MKATMKRLRAAGFDRLQKVAGMEGNLRKAADGLSHYVAQVCQAVELEEMRIDISNNLTIQVSFPKQRLPYKKSLLL
jgi:hypothetical protein